VLGSGGHCVPLTLLLFQWLMLPAMAGAQNPHEHRLGLLRRK